nr:MAG TPA: hypothetical protein [Caudoviricetes sp.]
MRVKVAKFTRQSRRKVAGIFPGKSYPFPKVARFYSKVASESR